MLYLVIYIFSAVTIVVGVVSLFSVFSFVRQIRAEIREQSQADRH